MLPMPRLSQFRLRPIPTLRARVSRACSNACSKRLSLFRKRVLFLSLLFWSMVLGWGLAHATPPPLPVDAPRINPSPLGAVDPVMERYQLGQTLYLENCATCHVGLPPSVMPSQTWADLLQDNQHYGVEIKPLTEPLLQLVWGYMSTYSRPIIQRERVPYRLSQSRYFKALHPGVEFSTSITPGSCVTCHLNAQQYDYRSLAPEWGDG